VGAYLIVGDGRMLNLWGFACGCQGAHKGASFGPQDPKKGLRRSRRDNAHQFISKLHAEADHSTTAADIPGGCRERALSDCVAAVKLAGCRAAGTFLWMGIKQG
jgi:hypothetical protein